MREIEIMLSSIEDVKHFVQTITMFDGEFELVSGKYIVDAKYLENLARLNAPAVKKIDLAAANKAPYKNNLRTMIQNNQAVMMAIVPRTFTAQDLNGDDKVTLSTGEKCGTLLSAI